MKTRQEIEARISTIQEVGGADSYLYEKALLWVLEDSAFIPIPECCTESSVGCIGKTKGGNPLHPCRAPYTSAPEVYRLGDEAAA